MYKLIVLGCLFATCPLSLYPMFLFSQPPASASTDNSKTDSNKPSTSTNGSIGTSCSDIYETKIKQFKEGSIEHKLNNEFANHYDLILKSSGIELDQSHISFTLNKHKGEVTLDVTKFQEIMQENLMQKHRPLQPQNLPLQPRPIKKFILMGFLSGFGTAALCGLSWLYANNYVKLSDFKIPFRA